MSFLRQTGVLSLQSDETEAVQGTKHGKILIGHKSSGWKVKVRPVLCCAELLGIVKPSPIK